MDFGERRECHQRTGTRRIASEELALDRGRSEEKKFIAEFVVKCDDGR